MSHHSLHHFISNLGSEKAHDEMCQSEIPGLVELVLLQDLKTNSEDAEKVWISLFSNDFITDKITNDVVHLLLGYEVPFLNIPFRGALPSTYTVVDVLLNESSFGLGAPFIKLLQREDVQKYYMKDQDRTASLFKNILLNEDRFSTVNLGLAYSVLFSSILVEDAKLHEHVLREVLQCSFFKKAPTSFLFNWFDEGLPLNYDIPMTSKIIPKLGQFDSFSKFDSVPAWIFLYNNTNIVWDFFKKNSNKFDVNLKLKEKGVESLTISQTILSNIHSSQLDSLLRHNLSNCRFLGIDLSIPMLGKPTTHEWIRASFSHINFEENSDFSFFLKMENESKVFESIKSKAVLPSRRESRF